MKKLAIGCGVIVAPSRLKDWAPLAFFGL